MHDVVYKIQAVFYKIAAPSSDIARRDKWASSEIWRNCLRVLVPIKILLSTALFSKSSQKD